ncbi:similar to Saccharomyces cerevisiae YKL124W SSH4 Specificity factor required for Rsp5p-dependent ubiquitination and sorting of cargo proteins at the multivesicular body [Maudiozyma saulgeensis]|uniref:Similar to Saccharomyces cerevisiae YKL124W SSH4 Specificity factor required for Rsp5p-dependent ubiquitination and sorting of cargo proteins at the multivesicular body n=1 Tax=Maudiozyma saulgeensis TaxID=1789683 RepID=A0A1X7R022_9SACH|nr:similar to Saccharomyces cerevisiae YKL124W SSH4 Specificity factor required for Rsp5p-dependent ubiquitination and sorting of cargo proteins at the multivesicular body [Kazachstania saulgeensis]
MFIPITAASTKMITHILPSDQQVMAVDPTIPYESNLPTPPPGDSDTETISIAFLISLSVTFAVLMVMLLIIATYVTFCGGDESDYDEERANGVNGNRIRNLNRPFRRLFTGKHSNILLGSDFTSPTELDDPGKLAALEKEAFQKMSPFEIELYMRAKELQELCPPLTDEFGSYLKPSDTTFIKDRGIQAFFFLPSINDNIDKIGNFLPSFIIQDKLDILFTKYNQSASTVLNYPLPYNKKDAVYFEAKVYKHMVDSNSIFSIGLSTVPYPYFRIPGMSKFSIAYESTGKLRINNPFEASTLLPKLEEGDVVGFGYKYKSGTIFITHNGKKLMDVTEDVDVDLFPCVGSFNASYTRTYTTDGLLEDPDNVELRSSLSENGQVELPEKLQRVHNPHNERDAIESDEVELQVNLGQLGFVFIEANVKKYAFNSIYGEIGIPPSYNGNEAKKDTILQKGEELPPAYPKGSYVPQIPGSNNNSLPGTSHSLESYERISSTYDRVHNDYDNDNEYGYHNRPLSDIDEETGLLSSSSAINQDIPNIDSIVVEERNGHEKKPKKKNKKSKKKKGRGRK